MSRLHAITATLGEVVAHFDATPAPGISVPSETVEGAFGLVVTGRESRRTLREVGWGFPRRRREAEVRGHGPERLGLVADLTNPMWQETVVDPRYRCLIVLTHFANPDGAPGAKTRTWFSVKDQPIVAWAGFCRNMHEFGPAYAGMTMDANAAIPPTNDRMPVLLDPAEYDEWLQGSIQDVIRFQYRSPFADDRMVVERAGDRWRSGIGPSVAKPQLAML